MWSHSDTSIKGGKTWRKPREKVVENEGKKEGWGMDELDNWVQSYRNWKDLLNELEEKEHVISDEQVLQYRKSEKHSSSRWKLLFWKYNYKFFKLPFNSSTLVNLRDKWKYDDNNDRLPSVLSSMISRQHLASFRSRRRSSVQEECSVGNGNRWLPHGLRPKSSLQVFNYFIPHFHFFFIKSIQGLHLFATGR